MVGRPARDRARNRLDEASSKSLVEEIVEEIVEETGLAKPVLVEDVLVEDPRRRHRPRRGDLGDLVKRPRKTS